MEPAKTIISLFGGDTAVAKILNLNRVSVARWKQPRDVQGLGGRIPQEHWDALIRSAAELGIEGVTVETLFRAPADSEAA